MHKLKIIDSHKGIVHFSVGALMRKEGKILLINRAVSPFGFACPAGHVEYNENPEQAIIREIKEEVGLDVVECHLILDEILYDNICNKEGHNHHWFIFECEVKGNEKKNEEVYAIGWYAPEEIKSLTLEPSWDILLKKLGII